MKQEDGFVRVGRPRKAQHGGPNDATEPRPARQAVGISRFDVALWNGLQSAIENLAGVGGCVQEQNDQRTQPRRGEQVKERVLRLEREEEEVGEEELDEQW